MDHVKLMHSSSAVQSKWSNSTWVTVRMVHFKGFYTHHKDFLLYHNRDIIYGIDMVTILPLRFRRACVQNFTLVVFGFSYEILAQFYHSYTTEPLLSPRNKSTVLLH